MALALKTCLPLLVSFCGPWFPLSCQCDSRGNPSRVLNINPAPAWPFVLKAPQKSTEETVSSESGRGEFSYLIHLGVGGGRGEGPE